MYLFEFFLLFLVTVAPVLLAIAFFTLAERKIIAAIQRRKGPNVIFFWGILQPIADGLKAILKELVFPKRIDFFFFLLGPLLTFLLSLVGWFIIPLSLNITIVDYNLSFIFFFVIMSLGFYGVLIASWASNSKYAMLAAFRSIAQIISYEIFIGLNILPIIAFTGSWNFLDIVFSQKNIWNISLFLPLGIIFFIALLAETNRVPFDLPEAEAEIVAGYNIEYSGFIFALFFLGEYSNMILNAFVIVLLFFGGWLKPFSFLFEDSSFIIFSNLSFWFILKVLIFNFLWIFIRATLPRYRYDQLMDLGWKFFLPVTLSIYYFYICLGFFFESFPFTYQVPFYSNFMDISNFNFFLSSEVLLFFFSLVFLLVNDNNISKDIVKNNLISKKFIILENLKLKNVRLLLLHFLLIPFVLFFEISKFETFFFKITNISFSYFDYLFIDDKISFFFKLFIWFIFFSLILFSKTIKQSNKQLPEFIILFFLFFLFLLLLPNCNNFLSLYLILEGSTISILALLLTRSKFDFFTETTLKYFCLSTISTMFLLIGISLIYFYSASFNFIEIFFMVFSSSYSTILFFGLVFLLLGFSFKLTLFPGHIWAPDIYEGLNFDFILIFSSAMKIAIFVVFLRFYLVFFFTNFNILLLILCIGSLIVGLFGALVQKNIKRFLAYSSINQLGFFTLGLVTKTQEGFSFTLVGFLIYNITLIFILFILNYLKTYKNKEINFLTDLKNLYIKNPIIAFLLLVIICSFAGIPPFIGFLSKFAILLSLLNSNYYFVVFFVLFLSLLSSYYYLKIIKLIFFEFFNKSNFSKMSSFFLNYPISRTSYSFYLLNFFFFFVIIYSFIYFWTFLYFSEILTLDLWLNSWTFY